MYRHSRPQSPATTIVRPKHRKEQSLRLCSSLVLGHPFKPFLHGPRPFSHLARTELGCSRRGRNTNPCLLDWERFKPLEYSILHRESHTVEIIAVGIVVSELLQAFELRELVWIFHLKPVIERTKSHGLYRARLNREYAVDEVFEDVASPEGERIAEVRQ